MSRTMKRLLVFAAAFVTLAFLVILINQVLQLSEFAARFHPVMGDAVFWGLIFIFGICLAVPVLLFLRLPRTLAPPEEGDEEALDEYLPRLMERLSRNPRLKGAELSSLEELEAALETLDTAAEESIRAAGSRAFLITAVSQSGALDGLMILGLQSRLVWEVAHVYAQRPTLRDMLFLYSNVVTTAFLATELDEAELSEAFQPVLSSVLGSAASAVPGLQVASSIFVNSVMTGTANAFLTLRVGVIAQGYSRALVRPERRTLRRTAIVRAAGMLGGIATDGAKKISGAIARASGKSITSAISGVGGGIKAAGSGFAGWFTKGGVEETGSGTGERSAGDEGGGKAKGGADAKWGGKEDEPPGEGR